jgi:hypothetical protein
VGYVKDGHERAGQDDSEDLPRILACVVHRKRLPATGQCKRAVSLPLPRHFAQVSELVLPRVREG